MARARNIKPSFFINEELVELPFATRLLFIGLWTLSDREGRLEDKPKKIKMALFPADDLDVNNSLNELHKSGFIQRYIINEIQYIQILAFKKHQNPHIKEPASTIPAPCENSASTVPAVLIPDSPFLIPETHTEETNTVENLTSVEPTLAASVCLSMKLQGITDINPSHPTLLALLNAGASQDEFTQAAVQAKHGGKGFSYAIGIVKKQREEAAKLVLHQGAMPASSYQQSINVAAKSVFKPEYIAEQTQQIIEVENEQVRQIA